MTGPPPTSLNTAGGAVKDGPSTFSRAGISRMMAETKCAWEQVVGNALRRREDRVIKDSSQTVNEAASDNQSYSSNPIYILPYVVGVFCRRSRWPQQLWSLLCSPEEVAHVCCDAQRATYHVSHIITAC